MLPNSQASILCPSGKSSSIAGMIPTGETENARKTPCASVTLSTTSLTWPGMVSNPDDCRDKPGANHLSNGTI